MLRDALISLSLANLCFFSVWGNLLSGSHLHYYMAMPPPRVAHVAILLNVLLLATLFWLGWTAANLSLSKRARSLARLIFLVFAFLALNGMRIYTQALAPAALSPLFIQSTFVVLAIGAIGIVSILYWRPGSVAYSAPAGVCLYWLTSNVMSLAKAGVARVRSSRLE